MAIVRHGNFQTLTFFLLTLASMAVSAAESESEALLSLKHSLTGAAEALESWKSGTAACKKSHQWAGVTCLNNGIAGLRLNQMNLSGKIDVNALTKIPGLRSLNVAFNNFSGPIPELNKLGDLRAIYLNGNQFSGEIEPDYFSKMDSLKKLWLASNRFTGPIPVSLGKVPNLVELHLEGNQFSGLIPPLEQPSLMSLDVSHNNLSGEIPPGFSTKNLSATIFQGNRDLCGEILGKPCNVSSSGPNEDRDGDHTIKTVEPHTNQSPGNGSTNGEDIEHEHFYKVIAFGLLIAAIIILLLMIIGIFTLRQQQLREEGESRARPELSVRSGVLVLDENQAQARAEVKEELTEPKTWSGVIRPRARDKAGDDLVMVSNEVGGFGLADLMRASAEVLGNENLGSSYKAALGNGIIVVAKRIKEMNRIEKDVLDGEIKRFGRLKHKNVLPPLAYHFRKEEKLLICEYVTKGCLLHQLHAENGTSQGKLNWPTRLKIIQGISQGLAYLHTELSSLETPHGNLKSSNVLLSPENEPLLTDYGYSGLISDQAKQSCLFAYKSPEYLQHELISSKSDVYCLGVLILEILTGKLPSQYLGGGSGTDVVRWTKTAIAEGRAVSVLDPEVSGSGSVGEMEELLHIGVACTEDDTDLRLDVREAARRIEEVQSTERLRFYEDSVVINAGTPSPHGGGKFQNYWR